MRRRLLLVEDDPTLRQALTFNLTREGYEVTSAADGEAALEAARNERLDLILLDVMLPGMSGVEVLRVLRREGRGDPGDHPLGQGRRDRPRRRPQGRRRRLRRQAVQPTGAAGAHRGRAAPAPTRDRRAGASGPARVREGRDRRRPTRGHRRGRADPPDHQGVRPAGPHGRQPRAASSPATSCSRASGATTTSATGARWTSTSAGCAASCASPKATTTSAPCAGSATHSPRDRRDGSQLLGRLRSPARASRRRPPDPGGRPPADRSRGAGGGVAGRARRFVAVWHEPHRRLRIRVAGRRCATGRRERRGDDRRGRPRSTRDPPVRRRRGAARRRWACHVAARHHGPAPHRARPARLRRQHQPRAADAAHLDQAARGDAELRHRRRRRDHARLRHPDRARDRSPRPARR